MSVSTQEIAYAAVMSSITGWYGSALLRPKWLCFCTFASILFALVHFLHERFRLLLVRKRESGKALLQLE
jgi:hypothetical protein